MQSAQWMKLNNYQQYIKNNDPGGIKLHGLFLDSLKRTWAVYKDKSDFKSKHKPLFVKINNCSMEELNKNGMEIVDENIKIVFPMGSNLNFGIFSSHT